jgi:DNA polymerase III alpha subunit
VLVAEEKEEKVFLNCHTSLSFKYGTLSVNELFAEAVRCGVHKLVLTEINNTASCLEMLRLCDQNRCGNDGRNKHGGEGYDLEVALGIEFRTDNDLLYVGIAKNNNGFAELNRFLSHHNNSGKRLPGQAPVFSDVFIIYPFRKTAPENLRQNEFIGVSIADIPQLSFSNAFQTFRNRFVILHPVTFADKVDFNIHRLLRAIDNNTLLSKLPLHAQASPSEVMISESDLRERFSQYPEIIEATARLLNDCTIDFNLGEDKNLKSVTGSLESDWDVLVTKAWEGFQKRYDVSNPVLRERFDRELRIIRSKNFISYYLVAYDLIQFANRNSFDYVGRGSGANSVVAYCLGITNVDPIELDLYFGTVSE